MKNILTMDQVIKKINKINKSKLMADEKVKASQEIIDIFTHQQTPTPKKHPLKTKVKAIFQKIIKKK